MMMIQIVIHHVAWLMRKRIIVKTWINRAAAPTLMPSVGTYSPRRVRHVVRAADCKTNRFAKAALRNGSALTSQYVVLPDPTRAKTVVRAKASAASSGSDQSLLSVREVGVMLSIRDMRLSIECAMLYAQGNGSVLLRWSRVW